MRLSPTFLVVLLGSTVAMCSAAPVNYNVTAPAACRSRSDVIAIAVQHASGQEYCECVCPANAPWRCDCSGLVSRAWGIAAPGATTYSLGGFAARLGNRDELYPGDILLWAGDIKAGTGHTLVFVKWLDQASGAFVEAACHDPAQGCTHGPANMADYPVDQFLPYRAHASLVCPV